MRGYISMVLGCPYDGDVDPIRVAELTKRLLEMGVYQVSLGDTVAKGTSDSVSRLLKEVMPFKDKVALHYHDTNGTAVKNILQSLEAGFTSFDSACGGLGGCPYSKSPKGNVSTESVVAALEGAGVRTGVELAGVELARSAVREMLR